MGGSELMRLREAGPVLLFAALLVLLFALRPREGSAARGTAAAPAGAGAPQDPARTRQKNERAMPPDNERPAQQKRRPSPVTRPAPPPVPDTPDDSGRMRPGKLEPRRASFRRDSIFKGGEVSQDARLVRFPRRAMPDSLVRQGVDGTVRLRYVVDTLGRAEPNSIEVLSAPHPELERQAVRAVRQSRYRAARKDGFRVRQEVEQDVEFVIESRAP